MGPSNHLVHALETIQRCTAQHILNMSHTLHLVHYVHAVPIAHTVHGTGIVCNVEIVRIAHAAQIAQYFAVCAGCALCRLDTFCGSCTRCTSFPRTSHIVHPVGTSLCTCCVLHTITAIVHAMVGTLHSGLLCFGWSLAHGMRGPFYVLLR